MELHTRSVSTVSAIAQMTFCIHQAGHSMSGAIPCSNFCLPWNFMGTCLQAFARNVFCICMNNRLECQVRRTCCGSGFLCSWCRTLLVISARVCLGCSSWEAFGRELPRSLTPGKWPHGHHYWPSAGTEATDRWFSSRWGSLPEPATRLPGHVVDQACQGAGLGRARLRRRSRKEAIVGAVARGHQPGEGRKHQLLARPALNLNPPVHRRLGHSFLELTSTGSLHGLRRRGHGTGYRCVFGAGRGLVHLLIWNRAWTWMQTTARERPSMWLTWDCGITRNSRPTTWKRTSQLTWRDG